MLTINLKGTHYYTLFSPPEYQHLYCMCFHHTTPAPYLNKLCDCCLNTDIQSLKTMMTSSVCPNVVKLCLYNTILWGGRGGGGTRLEEQPQCKIKGTFEAFLVLIEVALSSNQVQSTTVMHVQHFGPHSPWQPCTRNLTSVLQFSSNNKIGGKSMIRARHNGQKGQWKQQKNLGSFKRMHWHNNNDTNFNWQ